MKMVHEQEHSAQQVSAAFVSQYYNTLLKNTDNLFRFYKEDSTVSHAEFNESGDMITGLKPIQTMFESMDFSNVRIKLQFVESQHSLGGSIFVFTNGTLSTSTTSREFTQGFILAAQQPKGYYVLNDVFRYLSPLDGPDAKKPQPTVNFATFGSHGPASPTAQQNAPAVIPSHVMTDEQLSEADSTAATAGGSVVNTEDIISQAALSEAFSKENGHAGPGTISSSGSVSDHEDEEESDFEVSTDEKPIQTNGPTAVSEQDKQKQTGEEPAPIKHEEKSSKREQQKKRSDNKGKRRYQEETEVKKETEEAEIKEPETKVEPQQEKKPVEYRPVENPTSWAHAVFGSAYEPPQKPIHSTKNEGRKERGSRRDREHAPRGDRAAKKSEANGKGAEKQQHRREARNQNSVFINKLDQTTTEEDIKQAFDQFGTISHINNKARRDSFALVFFENRDAVEKALGMDGKLTVKGVTVSVQRNRRHEKTGAANGERREFRGAKSFRDDGFKKTGRDSKDRNTADNNGGWSVSHRGRGGRPRGRGGKPFHSGGVQRNNSNNNTATTTTTAGSPNKRDQ